LGDWAVLVRSLTAMDPRERPTAAAAAAMAAQLIPAVPLQGSGLGEGRRTGGGPCPAMRVFSPRRHRHQV
jgi:hypothetical protein